MAGSSGTRKGTLYGLLFARALRRARLKSAANPFLFIQICLRTINKIIQASISRPLRTVLLALVISEVAFVWRWLRIKIKLTTAPEHHAPEGPCCMRLRRTFSVKRGPGGCCQVCAACMAHAHALQLPPSPAWGRACGGRHGASFTVLQAYSPVQLQHVHATWRLCAIMHSATRGTFCPSLSPLPRSHSPSWMGIVSQLEIVQVVAMLVVILLLLHLHVMRRA